MMWQSCSPLYKSPYGEVAGDGGRAVQPECLSLADMGVLALLQI